MPKKVYTIANRRLKFPSVEPNKYFFKDHYGTEFSVVNLVTRVRRTSDNIRKPKQTFRLQLRFFS